MFVLSLHVSLGWIGFSRQIIGILEEYNADFGSFNILMDDEVRQGKFLLSTSTFDLVSS